MWILWTKTGAQKTGVISFRISASFLTLEVVYDHYRGKNTEKLVINVLFGDTVQTRGIFVSVVSISVLLTNIAPLICPLPNFLSTQKLKRTFLY